MHAWHRELTRKGQNCREQGRRNKRTPAPRHGATLLLRSAVHLYEASVARSQPLLPWKYHTHVRPAQCFARETHPPQNPQLSDFGSVLRNATCAGRIKHHHQQLGQASWQLPCNLRNLFLRKGEQARVVSVSVPRNASLVLLLFPRCCVHSIVGRTGTVFATMAGSLRGPTFRDAIIVSSLYTKGTPFARRERQRN